MLPPVSFAEFWYFLELFHPLWRKLADPVEDVREVLNGFVNGIFRGVVEEVLGALELEEVSVRFEVDFEVCFRCAFEF